MRIVLNKNATESDIKLCKEQGKDYPKVIISDYKSGSSAKLSEGYCNQLLLYVYMLAQKYQIPENELTDKFRCYLFYPLAGIKNIDINDSAKVEKLALKNTLEYKFTLDDYHKLISGFSSIIDKTNETDWKDLDQIQISNLSFSCSFCSFCGHPKYCKLSYDSGLFFPRSAKVMTKEEYKIWKENQKTN